MKAFSTSMLAAAALAVPNLYPTESETGKTLKTANKKFSNFLIDFSAGDNS